MKYKYGHIPRHQVSRYKEKLQKKIFWLLLYKDPNTKDNFDNIDYDKYVEYLMKELDGFNSLFLYPTDMLQVLSLINASYTETKKEDFDYKVYRKLVLDAQGVLARMFGGDTYDHN